jgi:hypothetical protein
MTSDERCIQAQHRSLPAMLKLDIDDEKRSAVDRLLAEAEEVLTTDSRFRRNPCQHINATSLARTINP